ncbi:MAG: DNA polymerase III subunit gamma/tau [Planctomycetes bacterium]|nr:DNA polymerase III subunit gamma/tau [Planctomycetota bacterium]
MAGGPGKDGSDAPYLVVARRFRPQTFGEMVGQDEVLQSLRVALAQQRIPHAFLFSGSRGVGKTTSARILARCLNCEQGPTPTPCGECELCRSILDGSNPDIVEIDAASHNGVDDVRALREHSAFASMRSRYKVFILDEVHMLSKGAFNALLKTLEEPPPGVVFVLATTELHKVPDTIRSRCQVLLFRRVGENDLQRRLHMIAEKEGVTLPDDVLAEIAGSVRGGVRDAETALERILPLARDLGDKFDLAAYRSLVSRVGVEATVAVAGALLTGDVGAGLRFARELQQQGIDEREALGELVETLRAVMLLKVDGAETTLVPTTGAIREQLVAMAEKAELHQLDAMISAGILGRERLRRLEDRGVVLEIALVRMAQAGALPSLADLVAEARATPAGAPVAARAPAAAGRPQAARLAAPGASAPQFGRGGGSAPLAAGAAVPATADLRTRLLAHYHGNPLMHTTLEHCRIDGPGAGDVVKVVVLAERKMFRDRLQAVPVQQEVTKVLRDLAGRDVRVEFDFGADGDAGGGASPAPRVLAKDAEPGPTTKRVLEKFRGRVVQVNPDDRVVRPPTGSEAADAPVDDVPPTPDD